MVVHDGGPPSGTAHHRVADALAAGEVHVWVVPPGLDDGDAEAGWGWLDPAERQRALGARSGATRDRFVGSRTRVRQVVGSVLDRPPESVRFVARPCPCGQPDRGRPALDGSDGLEVSISHAGSLVAVALACDSAIGVDIEETSDRRPVDVHRIARRFFSAEEQELVASDPAAFSRLWSRKEAVGKATGAGVAHGGLARDARADRVPTGFGTPELVVGVVDLAVPDGYVGAVASAALPGTVKVHTTVPSGA